MNRSVESSDFQALARRLDRLETNARRWRVVAAGAVCAAVLPWGLGLGRPSDAPADLTVKSLVMVDGAGLPAATLQFEGGSPVLTLTQGGRHASLTLADGSAGVACSGPNGVAFAGVSETGAYFNARGNDLLGGVFVGVSADRVPMVTGYSSNMESTFAAEIDAKGSATFKLADPTRGETQLPMAVAPAARPE
jgi:hypothetical protein